mgnify:CR=1 FL=1
MWWPAMLGFKLRLKRPLPSSTVNTAAITLCTQNVEAAGGGGGRRGGKGAVTMEKGERWGT